MRRVYKNLCPSMISASVMVVNMWKNSLKNVESDNNKILYETLLNFFYSEMVLSFWISLVIRNGEEGIKIFYSWVDWYMLRPDWNWLDAFTLSGILIFPHSVCSMQLESWGYRCLFTALDFKNCVLLMVTHIGTFELPHNATKCNMKKFIDKVMS